MEQSLITLHSDEENVRIARSSTTAMEKKKTGTVMQEQLNEKTKDSSPNKSQVNTAAENEDEHIFYTKEVSHSDDYINDSGCTESSENELREKTAAVSWKRQRQRRCHHLDELGSLDKNLLMEKSAIVVGNYKGRVTDLNKCLLCSWTCLAQECMYGHLLGHASGQLTCKDCGHNARSKTLLQEHIARVHLNQHLYACRHCDKGYYTRAMLHTHEAAKHKTKMDKYVCAICDSRFPIQNQLKHHIKNEHNSDGLFACGTCSKVFQYKSWYDRHLADICQATQEPYICKQCGAHLSSPYTLQVHVRMVHKKEKKEKCSFCSFIAYSKTQIKLHERIHTGEKPFKCPECQFASPKKYQLTSHLKIHSSEEQYHCEKCPFKAKWSVQLKKHNQAHLSSESVTCSECGVVFANNVSLVRHVNANHTNSNVCRRKKKKVPTATLR